ncbi:MAG: lamin tail domain-containing protein [Bacteroidetes bacterium]|nr:lamin tail domain-containing protein [Bacteroidota bacterium]
MKKEFAKSITVDVDANDVFKAHFTATPADPKLIMTEINYLSNPENDSGDWVELHNYGDVAINLYGWALKSNGDINVFEIPDGTFIQPGAYIVFVCDSQKFKVQYPEVKNFIGQLPFSLMSSGDIIRLFDYKKELYRMVRYKSNDPWPKEASGTGRTLELKDYLKELNSSSNWFAGCIGGSPGMAFQDTCELPKKEVEKENKLNPTITIKPNPSNMFLVVEIIEEDVELEDISLEIYDMTGNLVRQLPSPVSKTINIERKGLANGVYILKIKLKDNYFNKKLILF